MSPEPRARLPRWPFALLGAMTSVTILGPILIGWVLSGGRSANWPPDRPVEWATLLGTAGAVLVLMLACGSLIWTNRPRSARTSSPVAGEFTDGTPGVSPR